MPWTGSQLSCGDGWVRIHITTRRWWGFNWNQVIPWNPIPLQRITKEGNAENAAPRLCLMIQQQSIFWVTGYPPRRFFYIEFCYFNNSFLLEIIIIRKGTKWTRIWRNNGELYRFIKSGNVKKKTKEPRGWIDPHGAGGRRKSMRNSSYYTSLDFRSLIGDGPLFSSRTFVWCWRGDCWWRFVVVPIDIRAGNQWKDGLKTEMSLVPYISCPLFLFCFAFGGSSYWERRINGQDVIVSAVSSAVLFFWKKKIPSMNFVSLDLWNEFPKQWKEHY